MSLPPTMASAASALLPGVLREIEALIGLAGTLRLAETYGGVRLYVPMQMHDGHALAQLLGLDAAQRLAEVFGGIEHFDIPKAAAVTRAVRNRQMAAERAQAGLSIRQLALKYQLTERQVRNILGEAEEDDGQAGLFG